MTLKPPTAPSEVAPLGTCRFFWVQSDYLARGDGLTDDTSAIQNAINAASAEYQDSGAEQVVAFEPGKYVLTWQPAITATFSNKYGLLLKTGVHLFGFGAELHIASENNTTYHQQLSVTAGTSNWSLHNLAVTSDSGDSDEYHFGLHVFRGCDDWTVENCTFDGISGDAICVNGDDLGGVTSAYAQPQRFKIIDNTITNCYGQAMSVLNADYGTVSGNHASHTTQNGAAECLSFQYLSNVTITGNVTEDWGTTAIYFSNNIVFADNSITTAAGAQQALNCATSNRVTISGNILDSEAQGSIAFPPNGITMGGALTDITITGNVIRLLEGTTAQALTIVGDGVTKRVTITGNSSVCSTGEGVNTVGSGECRIVGSSSEIIVEGNFFTTSKSSAIATSCSDSIIRGNYTYGAISTAGARVLVEGNRAGASRSSGGTEQDAAILYSGDDTIIRNNQVKTSAVMVQALIRGTGTGAYIGGNRIEVPDTGPHLDVGSNAVIESNFYVGLPVSITLGSGAREIRAVYWMASAPASGTYRRGDVVWNTGAAAGGSPGWVCTAAGTPGTWKAMANVAA